MAQMIELLRNLSLAEAIGWMLLENVLIFGLSVGFGQLVVRWFGHRRVVPPAQPIEPAEIVFTISTILLNTLVTVLGWWLWCRGLIQFRTDLGLWAWLDTLVLLMVMDLAMYILHRIAHLATLFPLVHRTHHRYDKPHPLSLFVLNPFEALGFGLLWLLVIMVYDASWLGMSLYLALNVVFGTMGHLGVEPFPDAWQRLPIIRLISTSTFHAQHHYDPAHNFGFYTLIWDRLLGTLSPRYAADFGRLPAIFARSADG